MISLDITRARYHRIVIMTDADVDGSHIRTLLLTFFFRHMRELIEAGYLYIAQPPLFAISKGKKKYYAYTDEEKDNILLELSSSKKDNNVKESTDTSEENAENNENEGPQSDLEAEQQKAKQVGASIARYKGLGEMDADQLWDTTMNPENRVLIQVKVEDGEKADAIFNKLMGTEVELRKNFIQARAKFVKDLDI